MTSTFIQKLGAKVIDFSSFSNLKIGHSQDPIHGTGCTVLISEMGMPAGISIRGGGPASRETALLSPMAAADKIHAILLSGGSAYGLEASSGVMEYLEEKGIGFETTFSKVPLVCQSCIYDLGFKSSNVRPSKQLGYLACEDAFSSDTSKTKIGSIGAGTGATVGKMLGHDFMMKAGIGSYAIQLGDLQIGAIVVVNALGDVYDIDTNEKIAGAYNRKTHEFIDGEVAFCKNLQSPSIDNLFTTNTTIGAVITNAAFHKTDLQRIAFSAHNGLARTIRPIHTSADGDSIYAVSIGTVSANLDLVSTLSSYVVGKAINEAIYHSECLDHVPSYLSIFKYQC